MTLDNLSPVAPDQASDVLVDRDRLLEIAELGLDRDIERPELDALAREAAQRLDLPIGVVSIVLDEAQWFVATHGVDGWVGDAQGTPVEWSFCRYAVASKEAFVVESATEHELVQDNPLVQFEGIRCYAGIPMISSQGNALGSFCVIGPEERHFSEEDLAELRRRAERAVARIEARRDG